MIFRSVFEKMSENLCHDEKNRYFLKNAPEIRLNLAKILYFLDFFAPKAVFYPYKLLMCQQTGHVS